MAILADLIDAQITSLQVERARIIAQAKENVADVDVKLTALQSARKVITPDVETAYLALKGLGLAKDL